jgi:hypothetical protein
MRLLTITLLALAGVGCAARQLGYRDLATGALARRIGVADELRVADEHSGLVGAVLDVRIYEALHARGG